MIGLDIMPPNEAERLENLKKYKILNTKSEPLFDQLAAITATILNTPIAIINLVDRLKVWNGIEEDAENALESEGQISMCSFALLNDSAPIFEEAAKEFKLISNPLVAGEYGLRFYAAVPITTDDGFIVGNVCIVDQNFRNFSVQEQEKLEWVALLVRQEMNKRISLNACA